jgi:hypothetical protein
MRYLFHMAIVALVATGLSVPALAADAAKAPASPPPPAAPAPAPAPATGTPATATPPAAKAYGSDHSFDPDWMKDFHNPMAGVTMGADFRWRWEYYDNSTSFNDATYSDLQSYFRYRARVWTTLQMDKDIDINARMVYEPRTYFLPNSDVADKQGTAGPTRVNEALLDKLNVTMRNFMDLPVTAVIGRQDIVLGAGWLVAEGTPMDGSRTGFFDAARFTWMIDTENTLDLIYADQRASENAWLHPINSQDFLFAPTDDQDGMLYWTNKSIKDTVLEGYILYRNSNPVNGPYPNSGVSSSNSFKSDRGTYGGAISQKLDKNWDYRVEAAFQNGHAQTSGSSTSESDIDAWGTNNVLTYKWNDPCENTTHFGWEFLSGEDDSSITGFDTMWGKYARWSDLYANAYKYEAGPANWTNLSKFDIGHSFKLDPQWTLSGDYYLLLAPNQPLDGTQPNSSGPEFGSGNLRGQMLQTYLRYQYTKQLAGHLGAEYFFPGNYYSPDTRDEAMFFRAQLEYTF